MIKTVTKRVKRSFLWKIPLDELKEKVQSSTSLGQVLKFYGFQNKGRNAHTLKQRLLEEHIDFSHIKMGRGSNQGRTFGNINQMTIEEARRNLFVKDSSYRRSTVKRYLIQHSIFLYLCSECHMLPTWNGKPLILTLDHRNGISNDHRLENLRWLCPNCNSQTETFCGRRKKY